MGNSDRVMADISRILALPPPVSGSAGRGLGESRVLVSSAPASATAEADTDSARARQFRFRVYDGGRTGAPLGGDNGVPAQRARIGEGETASDSAGDTEGTAARRQVLGTSGLNRQAADELGLATPSSAFLAQLIAQEQLQPGLYDPPVKAADRAYRQAGGEPGLTDGTAQPHFQIAV